MFNTFQYTVLRYFETSFPVSYINLSSNDKKWITKGIKISCSKKRELYSVYRNNKDDI
jgi:hypothetical protein